MNLNKNTVQGNRKYVMGVCKQFMIKEIFSEYVLFGDDATFLKKPYLNRHNNNYYYYSRDNPFVIISTSQTRRSLNVWDGFVDHVIGTYFFLRNSKQ